MEMEKELFWSVLEIKERIWEKNCSGACWK